MDLLSREFPLGLRPQKFRRRLTIVQQSLIGSLIILSRYRRRVLDGVIQDVRQRYVGSVFGAMWAVIYPLLQLGIYTGLYTVIFKVRPSNLDSMGYVVLVCSGLVCLMAFSEALNAATSSLTANRSLLMNTVFPAELIPVRAAIAAQVTSMIGIVVTLPAGFIWGNAKFYTVMLVPIFWVLLLMFAVGIGWVFSLLSLVARDIQHVLGLITMLLFVLSPFAYTTDMVPIALRPIIYLNPLSYYVLVFQSLICYGTLPDPIISLVALSLSVTSFLVGFRIFQKTKNVFFDYA